MIIINGCVQYMNVLTLPFPCLYQFQTENFTVGIGDPLSLDSPPDRAHCRGAERKMTPPNQIVTG